MRLGVLRLQQFQSTLSDESVKSTRQDRTVVWVFVGSLHVGVEEIYKFVFLLVNHWQEYIIFSTHETIFLQLFFHYCKTTFSY